MAGQMNGPTDRQVLRQQAEAFMEIHPDTVKDLPRHDIRSLIHELRIYQVELEMQNEELRRAQTDLESERDRYTNLYDFSPVGYLTLDDKDAVLEGNLTSARLLGVERGLLKGTRFSSYVYDDAQDIYYLFMQKLKTSKDGQTCELRLIDKDDSPFYVHLECITVLDNDGNTNQIRAAFTDITQRKQAEMKIQDYQYQLKRLASELTLTEERLKSNIATQLHDRISQSLALVKMQLQQLGRTITDPEKEELVTDMVSMLGQILEESQSLTSQLSFPILNVMGLSKAVERWLYEKMAQKHGLNVQFFDDGLEKPLSDEAKAILFRSVREVQNNIVKHAQAANVMVRIQQDSGDIVVSIADDGIGFDSQVFLAKGSGFGLLSIRESLERLGGRLEIRTKEGPGSLVLLRLPLMLKQDITI